MEMKARAKSAKASDPIEDFILCCLIRWKENPGFKRYDNLTRMIMNNQKKNKCQHE